MPAATPSQKRGTIDVNRRLSETVAVRLNGMWQDSGVPGRDEVTQKGWGFAPSVGFGLGRPTTVTVGYQRLQQNNVPDYGLPARCRIVAVAAGKTVDDLDFSNFYGLLSRDHEKTDVRRRHRHRRAPLRPADAALRNLTRYGRNDLDRVVTPPRAASAANGGDRSRLQSRRSRRSAGPTRSISIATTRRSATRPT